MSQTVKEKIQEIRRITSAAVAHSTPKCANRILELCDEIDQLNSDPAPEDKKPNGKKKRS